MHYNDVLFDSIDQEKDIDLFVNYMIEKQASHPWKTYHKALHQRGFYRKRLGIDWRLLREAIRATKDHLFVIGSWADLTAMLCIIVFVIRRKAFVIWTDSPSLTGSRGGIFRWLRSTWVNFVFRNAKYVMGTGKMAINNLREMGCLQGKLINFPYFTNLEAFQPKNERGLNDRLVLLSSGRLVNAKKGFDDVIRALALLKREQPQVRVEYHIAGTGPDFDMLKGLVKDENLEREVTFRGWLEPSQLIEFYQGGDIYVHPARYEPYGVAVLEAMACGLAVLGSDKTGAVVDRVNQGVNGYMFKTCDINSLKMYIAQLIDDPSEVITMKKKSRDTAEEWPVSVGVNIVKKLVKSCVD